MKDNTAGSLAERLRNWVPDREFFMRSQGQVRFVTISSRMQIIAAAVVGTLLIGWLVTMAAMAISQYAANRDRIALLDRESKVASAESRVSAYRDDLDTVASDLARRQEFIEKLVDAHIGELPEDAQDGETVSDSRSEAAQTIDKVSAALPEARGLAQIEARQIAFVEQLTRHADRRAAQAAAAIRKLGLNPGTMLASARGRGAEGGPFLGLATSHDGSLDPRFQRLGISLARMDALERGLASIPQVMPANLDSISSSFGYRADPFTGSAAFHAGLDFRGPRGAPIYAAAAGTVRFAGYSAGYGNYVDIDHGNGLMTRYAHMSRIAARKGGQVAAGQVIGAIGSTGRSSGPHLHFEVRVHDRPVNPRPFLEAARNVRQQSKPLAQGAPAPASGN